MRNSVSPEAQRRHLYPPLFIWWLDFLMFPLTCAMHCMWGSEARAPAE